MNFGTVLFILFALVAVASFTLLVMDCLKVKNKKLDLDEKLIKKGIVYIGVFALSFTAMLSVIYLWANIKPQVYEVLATIFGGLGYSVFLSLGVSTFILHYYAKPEDKKFDNLLFKILCISVPVSLVFFFLATDGFAEYWTYPLVNGFNFSHGFVSSPAGGPRPNIAFYAICILSGAVFVYILCDHKFYLEYGKHGILESTFLVAFPAGIVGARIFYVVGNWEVEFAGRDFIDIINIANGGLTILGGAITGIVVGVLWFMWRNKGYNIWLGVDIIVPTILLAQGIGRWGNFFNCEVHGTLVDENAWKWLPTFVYKNAHFSDTSGLAPAGQMYAPLFLIEGVVNFLGYFVLAHLFGNRLRRRCELGDIAFGYLIWYGSTRAFMEPLRDGAYNMGPDGYWSWFWSLSFVLIGATLITGNHVIRYLLRKRVNKVYPKSSWKLPGIISTAVIASVGLTLVAIGAIYMASNPFTGTIGFVPFNIGLMILIYGASITLGLGISIPYMIEGIKKGQFANA